MGPDKFQQAWQVHSAETRVTVAADLVAQQVLRNQRDFGATILRRDVLEVGIGLVLLPFWFYWGLARSMPWTWWLTVPAILWVVGYFLVDRTRYPQAPSEPGEPLLACVKNSLGQVEHQIWLLRNVFWWYLMPFTISLLAFFGQSALDKADNRWEALGSGAAFFGFLIALYAFMDYINQWAVRSNLEPRRKELRTLAASLGENDSAGEGAAAGRSEDDGGRGVLQRWLIVAVVAFAVYALIVFVVGVSGTNARFNGPARSRGPGGEALAKLVTDQRAEKNLVGLAAMVMVDGKVEAAAAQGQRKLGSGISVELGDEWHLGGITKSITATMIARLIESGRMKWTDTVGQIFPEAAVHGDWNRITLRQLLTDTAGAPAQFPKAVWSQHPPLGPECTQARLEAVLDVIAQKPVPSPDEKYVYSNVGYTIAGAMAERATGEIWEDLVSREVFEPLQLKSAGFGPPKSSEETLEQPRGHHVSGRWKVAAEDDMDNTPIMGPAGTVRMSLEDLCTFTTEHLRGDVGRGKLLSAETYRLLHAAEPNQYACGWIWKVPVAEIPYTTVYWHNGSNTMWYSLVVFIPEMNVVVAVTSNDGDYRKAKAAAWEVVKGSLKREGDEARR
jgi:CubicO group peptidase (beta-lactamase class C family)